LLAADFTVPVTPEEPLRLAAVERLLLLAVVLRLLPLALPLPPLLLRVPLLLRLPLLRVPPLLRLLLAVVRLVVVLRLAAAVLVPPLARFVPFDWLLAISSFPCHENTLPPFAYPVAHLGRQRVHRQVRQGKARMSDTPTRDAKLVQFLNEAYAKERQLELALEAHAEVTTRDDYAKRLKDHLKETKSHATQLSRRIKQLGGDPETVSVPGPDALGNAAGTVAEKLGKAKAAVQGPLDTMRRTGEQERMLRNARVEYAEEAQEIATYMVIESLATTVGDKVTAKLARDILREEERMQKFLAGLLPELTAGVAHDEIPISEIPA
jgi:ferritin-like metal-binding protein YciE